MSHKHLLGLLGATLVCLGFVGGGWWLAAIWLGFDFLILAVAHARGLHEVFGKRADGTLPAWGWFIFLPLHAYTGVIWHLMRVLSNEPSRDVVTTELMVGRRLLATEVKGTFANYIDLTAEFQEPQAIRQSPGYVAFPVLDAAAPPVDKLKTVIRGLKPGSTFVHCAQGHGRTGLFAAAMLLASGEVQNVEAAIQKLRAARPGIRLNRVQIKCLTEFAEHVA